jgi:hypothetical protein
MATEHSVSKTVAKSSAIPKLPAIEILRETVFRVKREFYLSRNRDPEQKYPI